MLSRNMSNSSRPRILIENPIRPVFVGPSQSKGEPTPLVSPRKVTLWGVLFSGGYVVSYNRPATLEDSVLRTKGDNLGSGSVLTGCFRSACMVKNHCKEFISDSISWRIWERPRIKGTFRY